MALITRYLKRIPWLLLPLILSLFLGGLLILAVGQNPLMTYANLFNAGFSCDSGSGRCALVTALQFAAPLILSGLSATVALRGGFFSIGQAGQMLFGAAAASWLGGYLSLPPVIHPVITLAGAALFGGFWGLVPALLKHFIGVNEIIATLLLNPIAGVLVGLVWLPRVNVSSQLPPLIPSKAFGRYLYCPRHRLADLSIPLAYNTRHGDACPCPCSSFCTIWWHARTQTCVVDDGT